MRVQKIGEPAWGRGYLHHLLKLYSHILYNTYYNYSGIIQFKIVHTHDNLLVGWKS